MSDAEVRKPNLLVDFDDTLHDYQGRWIGTGQCAGGMTEGAREWLIEAAQLFTINICSTRSSQVAGVMAMRRLLVEHDNEAGDLSKLIASEAIRFPTDKPPGTVMLDDRAVRFTGEWPDPRDLLAMTTWSKRTDGLAAGDDLKAISIRWDQLVDAGMSFEKLATDPTMAKHPDWQAALRQIAREVKLLAGQIHSAFPAE